MKRYVWYIGAVLCLLVLIAAMATAVWRDGGSERVVAAPLEHELGAPTEAELEALMQQEVPDQAGQERLILSYAAKFVCTEALAAGEYWYGAAAPIVHQTTDVLIHNPAAFPVNLYKKAVIAPVERYGEVAQGQAPGKWHEVRLEPDYAFRIDCDDIAKLLTGNANATFRSTYGVGVTIEGFVVIGIGPQAIPGSNFRRYTPLDVTADYVRGSEVMKKDVHYQPWWTYWWWKLPWRLGYPYQRVLPIDPTQNIDCRAAIVNELIAEVGRTPSAESPDATIQALQDGLKLDPTTIMEHGPDRPNTEDSIPASPAALVALIGRCDKIDKETMSVDYVLVSNKGESDPDPRNGASAAQVSVRYPWYPGRWYDLAVVTPQNINVDVDAYFREWTTQLWVAAGADVAVVRPIVRRWYFPYWCGWGYWWWWRSDNCVSIGVGEGESLDVETITPVRAFMPQWPPSLD